MTKLTAKYDHTLMYASAVHGGHKRKGTEIPYISHLMAVSALVMEGGGDEDMAIAGLLHDAAEDQGGEDRLADIQMRFGKRVAGIVRKCSDSLLEDPCEKAPWKKRKAKYLRDLKRTNLASSLGRDYVLVTTADKLHNAQAILRDFRNYQARGKAKEFWARFTGKGGKSTAEIIGYYHLLADALNRRLPRGNSQRKAIGRELREVVDTLIAESKIKPDVRWAK